MKPTRFEESALSWVQNIADFDRGPDNPVNDPVAIFARHEVPERRAGNLSADMREVGDEAAAIINLGQNIAAAEGLCWLM